MLYLKYLCIKNNISSSMLAKVLKMDARNVRNFLANKHEFSLARLELLKDFFIEQNILTDNFDIGDFLNDAEIEDCNKKLINKTLKFYKKVSRK